jgi:hypothetical protein
MLRGEMIMWGPCLLISEVGQHVQIMGLYRPHFTGITRELKAKKEGDRGAERERRLKRVKMIRE